MNGEIMDDFYEDGVVTISDDEGNEYELEFLASLHHEDNMYAAFATAETTESDEVDIVIFRVADGDVENPFELVFEAVEDEDLLEEIYQLFMERFENEADFDDDDDGLDEDE